MKTKTTISILVVILVLAGCFAYYQYEKKWSYPNYIDNEPVASNQVNYGDYKIASTTMVGVIENMDTYEFQTDIQVVWNSGSVTHFIPTLQERPMAVSIVDINFDGRDDIEIMVSAGAYNGASYFYVFDISKNTFVEYMKRDGYVTIDREKKELSTFFKGRGIGDLYSKELYSFRNNAWELRQQEIQDTANYDAMLVDSDGAIYYVRTVTDFENGTSSKKSVTYYKLELPADDYGDFVEVPEFELVQKGIFK